MTYLRIVAHNPAIGRSKLTLAPNPIESASISNRGRERPGNSLFIDNVHLVVHNDISTKLELYFSVGVELPDCFEVGLVAVSSRFDCLLSGLEPHAQSTVMKS